MKLHFQIQRVRALTLVELVFVIALLAVAVALLLPILAAAKRRSSKINCVSNLKQVELAYRIWAGDNNDKYPIEVSVTNGGAMELIATGDVVDCFLIMSNELSTPKILICPDDTNVINTNYYFGPSFCSKNISYFVGADADEKYPERLLSGDDNFEINGSKIPPGLFEFSTNAPIAWSPGRHDEITRIPYLRISLHHHLVGNFGFADGSVGMFFTPDLQQVLLQTGLVTNHLAIP